jgi:4-amino-4-deoxy-L-arabinose transferase-like glycosyltransferase
LNAKSVFKQPDFLALLALATVVLLGRIDRVSLSSVDGAVYALVAKGLAAKPFWQWGAMEWHAGRYWENPHLTPWLLGLFMKVMGPTTLAATLPIALLSVGSVALVYGIGRIASGPTAGFAAGVILTLSPAFVKNGRNPMLEPGIVFFVLATFFLHLRWATAPAEGRRSGGISVAAGICFALSLLAKGPPGLLAPGLVFGFQLWAAFAPVAFRDLHRPAREVAGHLAVMVVIAAVILSGVEAWHRALTGESFASGYLGSNLGRTLIQGRGTSTNDLGFYFRAVARYWPWWPVAMVSGVVLWKRKRFDLLPFFAVGALYSLGSLVGFTAIRFKAPWYIEIIHPGIASLAAVTVLGITAVRTGVERFARPVAALAIGLAAVGAIAPGAISGKPREFERFFEMGAKVLGSRYDGKVLADCAPLPEWRRTQMTPFYFGAELEPCDSPKASGWVVDTRTYSPRTGDRIVFAADPFAIIER